MQIQLYRYAYIFGLSAFIVHKISSGYAMIYFYVIDIMMRKSISSFTIYADNIKNFGIPIWCLISYITLVKCNKNQLRLNLAFHENNDIHEWVLARLMTGNSALFMNEWIHSMWLWVF